MGTYAEEEPYQEKLSNIAIVCAVAISIFLYFKMYQSEAPIDPFV